MIFDTVLPVRQEDVLRALGYGEAEPDAGTACRLKAAVDKLLAVATPRYTYKEFEIERKGGLSVGGVELPGQDIAVHLQGCHACAAMALTLGSGVDAAIRAAEASDMAEAVLMDTAASVLAEQYADEVSRLLGKQAADRGKHITGRYSPGYGDLPVALQPAFVKLLDASRAIGLSTSAHSFIMTPRKSITALVGIADALVNGHLAGCESCALRDGCTRKDTEERCGAHV